jgi:general nucleoside transport system ATP-binding protein
MADSAYALEMRGITKRFPGVLANDQVDLQVRQGEIHALLGENGAGKSTLMNVLNGLYRPDEGEVWINGRQTHFHSPRDAIDAGIGMVHQHFMLAPTLTVTENLILGRPYPRFWINLDKLDKEIAALSQQYGLSVNPRDKIWQLSVGEQQRVELLKMLYHGAKILIMDEPTAVLTPQEVTDLFHTLREMAASGHTVIFISHKLDEVMAIADQVTVLRQGKAAALVKTAETSKSKLARLMVGREMLFRVEKKISEPGEPVLEIENAHCLNDRGLPSLNGLNLTIHQAEIVGLAGVAGNGQTELAELITGMREATDGRALVNGVNIINQPATAGIKQGVAHIPADRHGVGSAPNLNLTDNLIMKAYRYPPLSNGWSLDLIAAREQAEKLVREFNVSAPGLNTAARLLSGGNLQKLILAREIGLQADGPVKLIVAVYPSRGLDVGATEAVHRALIAERDKGAAILLISEDLDELLALSDRLAVIFAGQIVGEPPPDKDQVETIGLMMAGSYEK